MPQPRPEFTTFEEASAYFYEKFAASAPPRFERYLQAAEGHEIEAMAKYRWNLELSVALLPALHVAELTLRNAIHQAMCEAHLPGPSPRRFPDGSPADDQWWFDLRVQGESLLKGDDWNKVAEAFKKVPRDGSPITTSRVIAELSFGFWVELLNSDYEKTIVVPMLGSTMRGVQKKNRMNRTRGWLRARFGEIRDLRNRVSHHEPIHHRGNLYQTWEIAWLLALETNLYFAHTMRPSCKFKGVFDSGWNAHQTSVVNLINDIFERYKKV